MKKKIFINGDSFSALNPSFKVYSDHLKELLDTDVINYAVPGSSNHRILRTTLDFIIENGFDYYFIIALSYVSRREVWYNNGWHEKIKDLNKDNPVKLITESFVIDDIINTSLINKQEFLTRNINQELIYLYKDLWLLQNLLINNNSNYLIFSGANNTDRADIEWDIIKNQPMYKILKEDKNIIDLYLFNIPTWAKNNNIQIKPTGHLLKDGHKIFADYLKDNYIKNFL